MSFLGFAANLEARRTGVDYGGCARTYNNDAMIYRSARPHLDVPDIPLAEFVLADAARRGQRAALVDCASGRTITYAALPELVERAAAGFAELGLAKGGVCAIFAANTPEYVVALLAIARLGADVTEQCERRIACELQQGYAMTAGWYKQLTLPTTPCV